MGRKSGETPFRLLYSFYPEGSKERKRQRKKRGDKKGRLVKHAQYSSRGHLARSSVVEVGV